MPSQSPNGERDEERRLNLRTLAIASTAAACAALVTSQLWFAGTWIAAAFTPVIVALVSELLNRPTERIGRVLTSDRTAPFPPAEPPVPPRDPAPGRPQAEPDPDAPPPRGRPDLGAGPARELPADGAPVRVYRSGAGAVPSNRRSAATTGSRGGRRKIAVGVVALTAVLAFAIAMAAITVPELIAGQSLGNGDKGSTFLGGTSRKQRDRDRSEQQSTTSTDAAETTTPQTTPEQEQQQTQTTPVPTETTPPATTAPAPQAAPPTSTAPVEPTP